MGNSDWEDITSESDWEPVNPKSMTWGNTLSQAVSNTIPSGAKYGKDVVQPILHPVDTAKGLYDLSAGLVQKLVPGEQEKEKHADALFNFFKERYGGVENVKQTIANDPVGFLGDVASVFAGGGAALKAGGLAKTGKVLSTIGAAAEPLNAAMMPARALVKSVASSKIPLKMYVGAVKPEYTKKKGLDKFIDEAKTGLEEGIMPTEAGHEKLKGVVSDVEKQLDTAVEASGGNNNWIDNREAVNKYLPEMTAKIVKQSPDSAMSQNIINKTMEKFIEKNGEFIGLEDAIAKKKGLYKKADYGRKKGWPDERNVTYKAMARGLKDATYDALFEIHPELKNLGKKEGALLGLENAIEQGALRIAKRDIMGIGFPVKTGVATAVGNAFGSPTVGAAIGIVAGVMDTPTVKARLAIALNTAKKKSLIGKFGTARLGAYQAGRSSTIGG